MPFSDFPPDIIIPDEGEWRDRARRDILPQFADVQETGWYFCPEFEPLAEIDDQAARVLDKRYPHTRACARRNPLGDRFHNWCYRCYAGYMYVRLHIHDADRDRDRAILLH